MNTITLTAGELLGLEQEVADLLNHKLPVGKVKLPVMDLQKAAQTALESVKKIQNDLITQYGEAKPDGGIEVKRFKDDTQELSENYINFVKEFNEVLTKEYEIEFEKFPLEILDNIESNLDYRVLIKILRS